MAERRLDAPEDGKDRLDVRVDAPVAVERARRRVASVRAGAVWRRSARSSALSVCGASQSPPRNDRRGKIFLMSDRERATVA